MTYGVGRVCNPAKYSSFHRTGCKPVLRLRRAPVSGLTLLEVILALAILALSMAAIGELIRIGSHSARHAQDMTRAQILCESKMSEIVAGVAPYEPVNRAAMPLDPDWYYTVELAPTEEQGVMALGVMVERHVEHAHPLSFALIRWVPDPGIELPADVVEEEPSDLEQESSKTKESEAGETGGIPGFGN